MTFHACDLIGRAYGLADSALQTVVKIFLDIFREHGFFQIISDEIVLTDISVKSELVVLGGKKNFHKKTPYKIRQIYPD
jgi:hypothetical protein